MVPVLHLHQYLAVSFLMSVVWGGSMDGQDLHHYHTNRRRTKQQHHRQHLYPHTHLKTSSRIHRGFIISPAAGLVPSSHHRIIRIVPTRRSIEGLEGNSRRYTSQPQNNRNYRFKNNRYYSNPDRYFLNLQQQRQRQDQFYLNGFQTNPDFLNSLRPSNSRASVNINLHKRHQYSHQNTPKVILKDEPQVDNTNINHNPASDGSIPSFLDPTNFNIPDMDLSELQATVDMIDMHIGVKDNDPSAYTGSRVLVLLLREQCFRLQSSGDPDIEVFCQRFNNRFRSMLF